MKVSEGGGRKGDRIVAPLSLVMPREARSDQRRTDVGTDSLLELQRDHDP